MGGLGSDDVKWIELDDSWKSWWVFKRGCACMSSAFV